MKILICGANGQVGQALQIAAKDQNVAVVAAGHADLDITDQRAIAAALIKHVPDVVINAAAYTAVDKAEEDVQGANALNAIAPGLLAAECTAKAIPILHISTDFVFDGVKSTPYLETDTCNPLSVYGQSKLAGEQAVLTNAHKSIILRTAWVFGGEANFVNTMRRLAQSRPEINVVDDQVGGPTSAASIANALLGIAGQVTNSDFKDWGVYHFSGAPFVSWYEFACEILKEFPSVTVHPIPTSDYPTPAARPANSRLDCDKIKDVFNIDQPDWRKEL